MKRLATFLALAGLLAVAGPVQAQESRMINPDCNILCSPVFVNQHSVILTNQFGAGDNVDSDADFLFRLTTAFGSQFRPFFLVFLVQWTPFADLPAGDGKANSPAIVYGPGFHVLGGGGSFVDMGATADIFSLDLLPLIVYSGSAEEPSDYTHKLALEADGFLHIGKIIDPNNRAPFIHNTSIHVILDYLTDALGTTIPDGLAEADEPSRWVLIIGATFPFAPLPGG
ncbi:MAG: hypothetical protein GWN99_00685 [Gemmatimonadetes bacterium]|uniref:Uncharacterized protein n=1 Tax=Candidatus Kutchimonas denitrificans TaxID=3056748 RepID=A0AAE4Z5B8_9BACT|nr:hypothetical protein [Gemmatimonadota bacterium]NIR73624.1 hypothetical protein [Candidatus Kutchimonas denitrificans]NIR99583.1 hypothetical protein [Gemmatimonadota bacterium]NIT65203.1 hypothetical protein [Gemmatimonadota bacterium]NIV23736.1 hypothetical protein [Gemmatimonadota bacterium]